MVCSSIGWLETTVLVGLVGGRIGYCGPTMRSLDLREVICLAASHSHRMSPLSFKGKGNITTHQGPTKCKRAQGCCRFAVFGVRLSKLRPQNLDTDYVFVLFGKARVPFVAI